MWQKVAKFKGAEYFRKALYIYIYISVCTFVVFCVLIHMWMVSVCMFVFTAYAYGMCILYMFIGACVYVYICIFVFLSWHVSSSMPLYRNLNDDSPLGLRRILSQSTDSLNFRNRAMSMESLNDEGKTVIWLCLPGIECGLFVLCICY